MPPRAPDDLRPTERFTDRVEDYDRYRPGYPPEIVAWLAREVGLAPSWRVADVGSGTGRLSALFLDAGLSTSCVEPNAAMRRAAERRFAGRPGFHSVDGRAEATGLPAGSIDLVAAGQAFHWFDPAAARREFARILRPGGPALLVWNDRRAEGTPFMAAYEAMLAATCPDYRRVGRVKTEVADLEAFYGPAGYRTWRAETAQTLDLEGARGRMLSSSYVPQAGDPAHEGAMAAFRRVFDAHAQDGVVRFAYETVAYVGRSMPARAADR